MSTEINYEDVRKTILQAITIDGARNNGVNSSAFETDFPHERMTDIVGESLINLLEDGNKTHQDWRSAMWSISDDLKALLVLLATPGVLKQLSKHHRKDAAAMLSKLITFFDSINSEFTRPFFDFMYCGYGAEDSELKWLQEYYDFTKRGLHKHHNHFFGDYFNEKEKIEKMTAFYNQQFKR